MKHLMIDLETLGRTPGSVFHEVAAIAFDPVTMNARDFHLVIDIESAKAAGLHTDQETVKFWEDRGGPRQDQAEPLDKSLTLLKAFFDYVEPVRIWSWGSDFDLPILKAGFKACGLPFPFPYWTTRDARTVWDVAFPGVIHERDEDHNALEDCRVQIYQLQKALVHLRSGFLDE